MSMSHGGERGASGRSRSRRAASSQTAGQEVWRPGSDDRNQDPLPDLTQTLSQEISGYLTPLPSEFSVFVSTGQDQWRRKRQSSSQQSPDDGRPSTPFKRLDKSSHRASGHSRSTQTDSSLDVMSASCLSLSEDNVERRSCRELLSLSSRGSYSVIWRWSGDGSDRPNQQGNRRLSRSDSLEEWMCPPLPGQVPVGPPETSNGRTAQGAMEEASPVNKSSTEKPTKCRKRKGFGSFFRRLCKAMKSPFGCCFHSSAVDVVEPFVLPADLESEPDPEPSPAPDHSAVKTNNEPFESLYNAGEMIGSGGFGRVFEGTRKFGAKKVAIKWIRKTDNNRYLDIPGHPKPLVTEVALLLMMRREPISPYIIQLYEWFEHPRKFTLVMEFPEPCESLLDFIIRHPQLDETTARVIMPLAVLAVQHCIEHGVFHNDVHAQNFLLKKNTLELKLIDFGCGQLFSSDGYERDIYRGVLDYCPPEALTDSRFHAVPANVWSLGVLLYEMVNACSPFQDRVEITRAKVTFQNSSLSKGNNRLAVLGGGLELETRLKPEVQPQPDRNSEPPHQRLRACPRLRRT
ncbi:serine/threonine-protein kinase MARK1-like isoform X1 [Megalobrama amblycephala]|uniref:serine/threonine-protein kinase MARK1-like isoform X1 n=1 Tax=Megalobrama amblycephala TaxID=75352 RepID=UPI002013EBFA|nr:serine/threonine-protein kinase MARK1-like isoform X1 [Megalobrama amblycephala]